MRKISFILLFISFTFSVVFGQDKGNATFYSPKLQGRHTTDGSKYHPDSLTCAHKSYPLGTYLLVRNPKNNQQVVVKVTDRGPFTKRMMIDLSFSAAQTLDIIRQGVATVEVSKLNFIPQVISMLPTPQTYLRVEQMYVASNLYKKIFGGDDDKKDKDIKK